MNQQTLQKHLKLKDRQSFRMRYLQPALKKGFIELTIPKKPQSRLQQYRLTEKGQNIAGGQSRDCWGPEYKGKKHAPYFLLNCIGL